MGCGASKAAVIAPEQVLSKPPESLNTSSSTALLSGSKQNVKVRQRKDRSNQETQHSSSSSTLCSESDMNAQGSEVTSLCSRNSSATSGKSKGSSSSGDSGLGGEYTRIITEKSDETLREVANVSSELDTPDLSIDGSPVGKPNKVRSEIKKIDSDEELPRGLKHVTFAEKLIGELPDSPSILKRPVSRGGMAFDVSMGDNLSPQTSTRMPVFSSSSKRRKRLSYHELQEKQKTVEQRKKEHEQMIVERIRAREERDRQVKEALAKFAEMQTELASVKQKKQEVTTQNREAYLSSLRDKLKEKSTHVEEVKTAKKVKKLAPLNRPPRPNTGTLDKPVNLGAN